jgi:hypothetical protein
MEVLLVLGTLLSLKSGREEGVGKRRKGVVLVVVGWRVKWLAKL